MEMADIIGALAACASVASFAPQSWKIIKDRHTDGLSPAMYALTCVGFALWIGYGALKGQWPVIVPNAICLGFAAFILLMILLPRRQTEAVAQTLDITDD